MRQMEMEEEVIDLSELLRLLWSHVLQIVAVGLVAAVILSQSTPCILVL